MGVRVGSLRLDGANETLEKPAQGGAHEGWLSARQGHDRTALALVLVFIGAKIFAVGFVGKIPPSRSP
jgi:hypothetical protein